MCFEMMQDILNKDEILVRRMFEELKHSNIVFSYEEDETPYSNLRKLISSIADYEYNQGYMQGVSECE